MTNLSDTCNNTFKHSQQLSWGALLGGRFVFTFGRKRPYLEDEFYELKFYQLKDAGNKCHCFGLAIPAGPRFGQSSGPQAIIIMLKSVSSLIFMLLRP